MLCEAAGFKNNHTGSLLKSNLVPTGSQAGCGVREFCASAQELRSRVQQRCGPKRYASTKIKLQSSPLRHALSKTSFPNAKSRKDQVKDIVCSGLAGKRIEMAKGSVQIQQHHLMRNILPS